MIHETHLVPNPSGQESTVSERTNQTKLAIVEAELRANPNVFYAGEIFENPGLKPILPGYGIEYSEFANIIVSPKKPIFDLPDLNRFMHGLIRGIKPSWYDDAWCDDIYHHDGGMQLGRLTFDEIVTTIQTHTQTQVTSLDPEATTRLGMLSGTSEENICEEVWRRIWIRVYPEPITAGTLYALESGAQSGTLVLTAESADLEELVGGKLRLRGSVIEKLKAHYGILG